MADIPNSDSEQTVGVPAGGAQSTPSAAPAVTQTVVGNDNVQLNLQHVSNSNINLNLNPPIGMRLVNASGLGLLGPREWVRPTPPRPSHAMIGRAAEFEQVSLLLAPGAKTAITGTITAAVHGTPGVGKTLLAEHLAVGLAERFPGGVLLERFGASFRNAALAQPILDRWGSHAFGRRPLEEGSHFTPDAVCDLLAGHGALLVILDDVWDLAAVQPLMDSLPIEACLLITTRSQRLARDLGGKVFPLDVLTPPDAQNLLKARAHAAREADQSLLAELAQALGYHALALNLAGRSLDRLPRAQWAGAVQEMSRQVREGQGFGELNLPGDEEGESRVAAALKYSYDNLDEDLRKLYRSLGAFAADADFSSLAAALLWDCSVEQAQRQLSAFVERGLLDCLEEGMRWRQHSLLRAYSLGLLRGEGEETEARTRHAVAYLDLMREANGRQVYSTMLPDYPQLRQAFAWVVEYDLDLAQALAWKTAELQAAFGLAGDGLVWSQELVEQARAQADAQRLAAAQFTLGNALQRIAGQARENRGGRLLEALAAYNEALRFRTSQAAPLDYAATQNNRGAVLSNLAGLGGEDRGRRLREALAAYDEALRFYTPEAAPLGYAGTQNNRGAVLSELARLGGEDRGRRLREALAAYDEALRFRTSQAAPLDYSTTHNNRGAVLRNLAGLGGEDRGGRLREALAAYNEALRFYMPEAAPLDYAMTQNNRGALLRNLAGLGEENRGGRLQEALKAYNEALRFRTPESAPMYYAITHYNVSNLFIEMAILSGEDRTTCLLHALQSAGIALEWFKRCHHEPYSNRAVRRLRELKQEAGDLFPALWAEAGLGEMPEWLE